MGRRAADVHRLIHVPLIDWQIDGQVVADGRFLFQLGLNAPVGAGVALFFRRMIRKTTEQVMKKVGRLPGQHSTFDSKWSPWLPLDSDTVFRSARARDKIACHLDAGNRARNTGRARSWTGRGNTGKLIREIGTNFVCSDTSP